MKRVTLEDIAKLAGVTKMSVSHVLSGSGRGKVSVGDEKRELIKKIAAELNYIPNTHARELNHIHLENIGIIVDYLDDNVVGSGLLAMVQMALAQHNFCSSVIYCGYSPENHQHALKAFIGNNVDGIIVLGADMLASSCAYGSLNTDGVPTVCFAPQEKSAPLSSVEINYENGAIMAVNHLIECGRKRNIIMLPDLKWFSNIKRREGYLKACEINLLGNDDMLVFSDPAVSDLNYSYRMRDVVSEFIDWGVTGILTYNDMTAMALIQELENYEIKVPDDIAVISLLNSPFGVVFHPQITSVDYQVDSLVNYAVSQLDSQIHGSGPSSALVSIPPRLLVRDSA